MIDSPITGVGVGEYNGFTGMTAMFWVNWFSSRRSLASIGVHLSYIQVEAGNPAAASRLPRLVAGLSSILSGIAGLAFR